MHEQIATRLRDLLAALSSAEPRSAAADRELAEELRTLADSLAPPPSGFTHQHLPGQGSICETFLDGVPTPVFFKDAEGRYRIVNLAAETLLGLPREELRGKTLEDALSQSRPVRQPGRENVDEELLESPGTVVYEVTFPPSGERYELTKATILGPDETPVGIMAVAFSIEAREAARMERDAALATMQAILAAIPGEISVVDKEFRLLQTSLAAQEQAGDAAPLAGEYCYQALADRTSPCPVCPVRTVLETGRPTTSVCPAGSHPRFTHDVKRFVSPLTLADGSIAGAVDCAMDISDLAALERELLQAKETAETASRAKSIFLANISHELRTPVNGILGMAQLALDSDLTETQRDYLEALWDSAKKLSRILGDILDFVSLEAKKLEPVAGEFSPRELLSALFLSLAHRAEQSGHTLSFRLEENLPEYLHGDSERLSRILHQLLDNALKFSHAGEVLVRAGLDPLPKHTASPTGAVAGEGQPLARLHVRVSDPGPGIPAEHREEIFEQFHQLDGEFSRTQNGMGLGLALARRMATLLGGSLWLDEESGPGATFHVTAACTLPDGAYSCEDGGPPCPPQIGQDGLGPLTLLVADDNQLNRSFMERFLTRAGHKVLTAGDGEEALALLAEPSQRVDLVLMDIQMPRLDGLDATRALRAGRTPAGTALGDELRDVPVIALTAHTLMGDRERFLGAGMDDVLVKPLEPKKLARLLELFSGRILRRRQAARGDG